MGWTDTWATGTDYTAGDIRKSGVDVFKCLFNVTYYIDPTGNNDPDSHWTDEAQAYNNNESNGATNDETISADGWSSFLELTVASGAYSGVRIYWYDNTIFRTLSIIDIDFYYGGAWHDMAEAEISDNNTWQAISGTTSVVGVTKARVRFKNSDGSSASGSDVTLKGFDFIIASPEYDSAHWQKLTGGGILCNF